MIVCDLRRVMHFETETIGILEIEGNSFFTLELPDRGNTPNLSRIPAGDYLAKWGYSPKYRSRYELKDVPDRTAILIHAGNTRADTQGCILLGERFATINGVSSVVQSRKAIKRFHELTQGADLLIRVSDGLDH